MGVLINVTEEMASLNPQLRSSLTQDHQERCKESCLFVHWQYNGYRFIGAFNHRESILSMKMLDPHTNESLNEEDFVLDKNFYKATIETIYKFINPRRIGLSMLSEAINCGQAEYLHRY